MEAYVGLTVQWFVRGNKAAPPLPAIVTVVHPGGMLSLSVCDENSVWSTKRSVWRMGDDRLRTCPKLAEKVGAWDFAGPPVVEVKATEAVSSQSAPPVVQSKPAAEEPPPAAPVTREGIEVAKKKELQKATTPA